MFKKKCPHCKAELVRTQQLCQNCGTRQTGSQALPDGNQSKGDVLPATHEGAKISVLKSSGTGHDSQNATHQEAASLPPGIEHYYLNSPQEEKKSRVSIFDGFLIGITLLLAFVFLFI